MRQAQGALAIASRGAGLYEFTDQAVAWVSDQGIAQGLLTVFVRHTSCSLVIQENADPDVMRDLDEFFRRLAPENASWMRHRSEGPDDMPAHIKAALTQTSLAIPLIGGRPALGTWQGIYLFEHRARPHRREVILHAIGA